MTQEEILEYNKRCAEFLGVTLHESQLTMPHSHFTGYHSDWNWIMEVVEAIEEAGSSVITGRKICGSFEIKRNEIKFYFNPNGNYLLHLELKPFLTEHVWKHPMYKHHIIQEFDFKNNSKQAAVVQAINKFLIWHNESY